MKLTTTNLHLIEKNSYGLGITNIIQLDYERKIGCVTKKVALGSAGVQTRLAQLMLIKKEAVHIARWGVDRLSAPCFLVTW